MYNPRNPPPQWDTEWLAQEFRNIQQELIAPASFTQLTPIYVTPKKVYPGLTVLALSPLNLGSGDGVYTYYAGSWKKLG